MTKAQAASAASAAITAGYTVNAYPDNTAGTSWHVVATTNGFQPTLAASTLATFATTNSIATANVPSADLS
jgi:hypothetical protein